MRRAFAYTRNVAPSFVRSRAFSTVTVQEAMASPKFWDSAVSSGYEHSLFGFYCGDIAKQLVRRHSAAHGTLLDVGTGTGAVAIELAQKYPDAEVRRASAVEIKGAAAPLVNRRCTVAFTTVRIRACVSYFASY